MYEKVHLRLTILCAGITAAIMIIMSFSYLYISETGLHKNQFNSFKNDMNTITTNLEGQSVISMEWISKMEAQGNYSFYILDNGIPYLYNQLNTVPDTEYTLFQEALDIYNSQYAVSLSEPFSSFSPYFSFHMEYPFTSPSTGNDYYGCIIEMIKKNANLQIIVLSSLNPLEKQILIQRILFIMIDFFTVFLLGIFSWFFTGKLLKPILENQQKQAQFVASASHELRTPLAVILSSAECCREISPDGQAKFLNIIKQEGLRMSSLIDDMLLLSGSDSKKFPLRVKPVELDTLLLNIYEAFEPIAKEKSISLSLELPESSLPACSCDPDRIKQVISILLHNALSYTETGGFIKLYLSCQKEHFYISVTDNGIGISDEDKKRIFDRFYRVEKSRSTKGHFGLGLSIAYEIMKSHGGTIGVKDADLKGSTFYICIPN